MDESPAPKAQTRLVILVQPNLKFLAFACPPPGSMPPEEAVRMEAIVSPAVKRNIVAIAKTLLVAGQKKDMALADEKTFRAAGEAIPFLGLLIGLAYIGHVVRIFNGRMPPVKVGSKDADLMIVDSAVRGSLPEGWETVARETMRTPNILVHDRATYQLRVIHKVGEAKDRIEFR